MRDDVTAIIADLTRRYARKLEDLNRLLSSEQEKLHFIKSGNLDKIFELIETDNDIIDLIDLSDFEIARSEEGLARIVGTSREKLYALIGPEAAELTALRGSVGSAIGELCRLRETLADGLETEHRQVRENIAALSRIDRLKRYLPE